ncbi:MAG: hypothetical protein JWM32_2854 [Verrucomicrobia bacterium]|nr:hypothetical protein [Verrucomicrobiota bacterium]
MKINSAEFKLSAPDLRSCPNWAVPEIAVIGRSNVGKSSLVNLLTERRALAMVSDLPGKTKLLNFFHINGSWALVDLPGYGYAAVGEQRRRGFNAAVADYLDERENLRRVYVLIDSRLEPQPIDLEFLRWLETCEVPYSLIFTKADKQSSNQTLAQIATFKAAVQQWRAELPEIIITSSKTRKGRSDVLDSIAKTLAK